MNLGEFLAMGGYGFYVWGSYIVAAVVLCIEIFVVRARRRAARLAVHEEQGLENRER